MLFCYRRPVDMISFQIGIIQMRWVFVHSGCPYICAWACCVKCVWSELGLNMYNTFKTLSMQWWTSRAMRSGILRSRSLLVLPQNAPQLLNYLRTSTLATYAATPTTPQHTPLLVHLNMHFTTCTPQHAPQLLAHLHPGHLCSSSHHPTTYPTTCAPQLRGHLCNIYSGFAQPTSSTQACQLGDLVHLHCSHPWSHHPTNLVPLRSGIKHFAWVCTAGPTILLKTPVCVVSPLPVCWAFACTICDLCLIGHLYYVSHTIL